MLWFSSPALLSAQQDYLPGVHLGNPTIEIRDEGVIVQNAALTARWSLADKRLRGASFSLAFGRSSISLP
jgi:hypothetical protein